MKISIIIPAYNEQNRIERTITEYHTFFESRKYTFKYNFEILVVLNGCTDKTAEIVDQLCKSLEQLMVISIPQAGKGRAIKAGFEDALTRPENYLIGFVDADMATAPQQFFDLIGKLGSSDGIIASRYMLGAEVTPQRPAYKRLGSKLIYEPFVLCLFGLNYYDLQCGAKLFKRAALEKIVPLLSVEQWSFDVEILYLCKKLKYFIKEVPTIWHDQKDSKLTIKDGLKMFSALFAMWRRHVLQKY